MTLSSFVAQTAGDTAASTTIISIVPHSYGARLPSRADVMRLAADRHNLHPAAGGVHPGRTARDPVAKRRRQGPDRRDQPLQANTSMGSAKWSFHRQRRICSRDLLSSSFRSSLNHTCIAMLLASDGFNISRSPNTFGWLPTARPAAPSPRYRGPNAPFLESTWRRTPQLPAWPDDNIRALGFSTPPRPGMIRVSVGWGNLSSKPIATYWRAGIF